ncbi:hypothetical protein AC249_AIPGENE22745 [Exaiptasia diaphana]|nr:hypothetical protein AC249_AIPGENE22745 [Exaiptasia diaphana]
MYGNQREIVVRGDGNCFYRSIALWKNKNNDKNYQEIRKLCCDLIEDNQHRFMPFLFAKKSVFEHVTLARREGTWAETMDIFSCASLLSRPIYLFSMKSKQWLIFKPLVGLKSPLAVASTNHHCDCPITLAFHDYNPATNHFNLLLPNNNNCCTLPVPKNSVVPPIKINLAQNQPSTQASSDGEWIKVEPRRCKRKATCTVQTSQPTAKQQQKVPPKQSTTVPITSNKPHNQHQEAPKPVPTTTTSTVQPSQPPAKQHQRVPPKHSTAVPTTSNKPNNQHQEAPQPVPFKSEEQINEVHKESIQVPKCPTDFESMSVKELKRFVSSRGITASTYNKDNLITLAKAAVEMNLISDPDFQNDSMENCLKNRLMMPSGKELISPCQMKDFSNDFSLIPPFGLMDIFNHLIMHRSDYDKEMLASWRSFDDYSLFESGHVQELSVKPVIDNDGSKFFVFVAGVLPSQRDKTQENAKKYKLCFILDSLGSVFSAFCNCKGGGDQGCRHLGATLFELEDFLSNKKKICDIYSFDPRPNKHRQDATDEAVSKFATKLENIDSDCAILDYLKTDDDNDDNVDVQDNNSENITDLQNKPKDIGHLTINSRLESNLSCSSQGGLSGSPSSPNSISKSTPSDLNEDTVHLQVNLLLLHLIQMISPL